MNISKAFNSFFFGKKIIVTGHTGFKGSWLISWLLNLGADVYGLSESYLPSPSHFEILSIEDKIHHKLGDIRDLSLISEYINEIKPDVIFHLAAQAIVSTSYSDPLKTITTNITGTANILEASRKLDNKCAIVLITSDKCYENKEWIWGYRENDQLGGKDIYSASKGSAELIIRAYLESFFHEGNVSVSIARAGNVIGGGDWAKYRIIPDIFRSWSANEPVYIRSPNSTRPWQHVLEPLSGYLTLAEHLWNDRNFHSQAFNFGPKSQVNQSVIEIVHELSKYWINDSLKHKFEIRNEIPFNESKLLKLNCDKAFSHLSWEANLNFVQTAEFVGNWYKKYYLGNEDMFDVSLKNILDYQLLASEKGIGWAND